MSHGYPFDCECTAEQTTNNESIDWVSSAIAIPQDTSMYAIKNSGRRCRAPSTDGDVGYPAGPYAVISKRR